LPHGIAVIVRYILVLPLIMLLAACNVAVSGELPKRDTEIDRSARACSKPLYCGDIGYADCNSAADGPAYYFDRKTGKIIATCGGACMYDADGRCKRECPPKGWACRQH
jgi:hypothetical protein